MSELDEQAIEVAAKAAAERYWSGGHDWDTDFSVTDKMAWRGVVRKAITAYLALLVGPDSPEQGEESARGYRVVEVDGGRGNIVVDRRQGERRSDANSPRSEREPQRRKWGSDRRKADRRVIEL